MALLLEDIDIVNVLEVLKAHGEYIHTQVVPRYGDLLPGVYYQQGITHPFNTDAEQEKPS